MNKLQWNVNWNSYIFIQENAFENVVWEMEAILSQPQCVKDSMDKEVTVQAVASEQAVNHYLNQRFPIYQ